MKIHIPLASTALLCAQLTAAPQQVGDLRIGANDYKDTFYYVDPGIPESSTRNVAGAPLQLPSTFSGTSQNPTTVAYPGDSATDFGIVTSPTTTFKNPNRYTCDPDGPGPNPGPQRLGAFQYTIDLTPVETYLTSSGDTLTELTFNLDLTLQSTAQDKAYDVYLSYTNATESITETSISPTDPGANYNNFWLPAQAGAVGDVIGGTHKIVNLAQIGDIVQGTDLLPIYNAGVRQVRVIVAVPSFFSGRTMAINTGSGIRFATNNVVTEQICSLQLDPAQYPTYYYADQFGPLGTPVIGGATVPCQATFIATSQNQGGNPEPIQPAGMFSLDGNTTGTNTFSTAISTITAFGPASIGATASDQFQYVAWRKSGDFTVTTKLETLTTAESGARAGLMIRGSTSADSAHAFVGFLKSGEPVAVIRDANGNTATQTLGTSTTLPQWVRIVRTGTLIELFTSSDGTAFAPAPTASATISFTDPVFIGEAATSGSATNNAVATFSSRSTPLADSATDIGIRTFSSSTQIQTLSRFGSTTNAGVLQWSIDLSPLDAYLSGGSLTLDSLSLKLLTTVSDAAKPFDVYLSYTNPAETIQLTGISTDNSADNYTRLMGPAIGASPGDIVNGTHKVLIAQANGAPTLDQNLLALYTAGVRNINLIIASSAFYSARQLTIVDGSGLFIETTSNSTPFQTFMSGYPGLTGPDALAGADPDADGVSNVGEFIMGGTAPNDGGAVNRPVDAVISDHLTISLLVPSGATFAGTPSPSATVQGINVTAGGSLDLITFNRNVEETTVNPGLPGAPAGYDWHTFRLADTIPSQARGFLRVTFEQP